MSRLRVSGLVVLLLWATGLSLSASAARVGDSDVGAVQQTLLTQEDARYEAFLWETELGDYLFERGRSFGLWTAQLDVAALPPDMLDALMNMVETRCSWEQTCWLDPVSVWEGTLAITYEWDGSSTAKLFVYGQPAFIWVRAVPQVGAPSSDLPSPSEGGTPRTSSSHLSF
jgi:hypothetical protein